MNDESLERVAKALADPRRRELLEILARRPGLACCELTGLLNVSQPTVSHHVTLLAEAELVDVVREGNRSRLSVRSATVDAYLRETASRLSLNH